MRISRRPAPPLRPFVETVWAIDDRAPHDANAGGGATIERVLPTGAMHLVFRISDTPLRVFDDASATTPPRTVGCAIVGGARSTFYVRDVSLPVCSVGAQFRPGAAPLLFGVPADALAGGHTRLEDLWGREAGEVRARLAEAPSLEAQLALFESVLARRLPTVRGPHPAVAEALEHFACNADVERAVVRSGYSPRHFIQVFREAVGLGPKTFGRVRRFQRTLGPVAAGVPFSRVALEAGYSDQSHFNRDFRELSGMAPRHYAAAKGGNHVAVPRHEGPSGPRGRA